MSIIDVFDFELFANTMYGYCENNDHDNRPFDYYMLVEIISKILGVAISDREILRIIKSALDFGILTKFDGLYYVFPISDVS